MIYDMQSMMIQVITWVYSLMVLGMLIVIIVQYGNHKTSFPPFKSYKDLFVVIYLCFEVGILLINAKEFGGGIIVIAVLADIIQVLKLVAFVYVGFYYTRKLGLHGAPLLGILFADIKEQAVRKLDADQLVEVDGSTLLEPEAEESVEVEEDLYIVPSINWSEYMIALVISITGIVSFTYILFSVTNPKVGIMLQDIKPVESLTRINYVTAYLAVIEVSILEELTFRLGMLSFLMYTIKGRYGVDIAIWITAIIWTMGHAMSLDPVWVKMVQILPWGILLG